MHDLIRYGWAALLSGMRISPISNDCRRPIGSGRSHTRSAASSTFSLSSNERLDLIRLLQSHIKRDVPFDWPGHEPQAWRSRWGQNSRWSHRHAPCPPTTPTPHGGNRYRVLLHACTEHLRPPRRPSSGLLGTCSELHVSQRRDAMGISDTPSLFIIRSPGTRASEPMRTQRCVSWRV